MDGNYSSPFSLLLLYCYCHGWTWENYILKKYKVFMACATTSPSFEDNPCQIAGVPYLPGIDSPVSNLGQFHPLQAFRRPPLEPILRWILRWFRLSQQQLALGREGTCPYATWDEAQESPLHKELPCPACPSCCGWEALWFWSFLKGVSLV